MLDDKDIRDAFFDEIYDIGAKDKNVVILTNDMDVFSLRRFKKEFPDRFINMGVAEQNMINVAAGLSSCGKKVYIYGISSFVIFRCFEQIKFNICSMNLPVVIVGLGTGLSFEYDGPSHHVMHDVSAARALSELEVYNPCDEYSASHIAKMSHTHKQPMYVRIDKNKLSTVYTDHDTLDKKGWHGIRNYIGTDVLFISSGIMTSKASNISDQLVDFEYEVMDGHGRMSIEKICKYINVVDVWRVKPIDQSLKSALERMKYVFTFEEHSVEGGLGTSVAELIADNGLKCKLVRFGLNNQHIFKYGDRKYLQEEYDIDDNALLCQVSKHLGAF